MGKNIGWNGKALREMLAESEALSEETGNYYGLKELNLKEAEPIRYEKIFSRLRGGLVTARETCMNISASPIVQEEGELCFALYTPEGDSVVVSTGILVHIHTMSESIKYMIRNHYEENPGIAPGDIFTNNDTSVGQVHNVDVATMVPVFWEAELVGWAAAVTHELDVGSQSAMAQTDTFDEGLILPALKIGENDTIRRDYQFMCQRRVRTPMYWNLDERARVAGCHLIRDAVYRVIEQEGIDTYKQFIREVIEDGRRTFITRIKELLVPGTYQSPAFADACFTDEPRIASRARKDILMHAPFKVTIGRDGSFNLSFDGASGWGWHSFNCTPTAIQGAMWVLLTQTVMPNDKLNDGAYLATTVYLPPNSWANVPPIAATYFSWGWLFPAFSGMFRSLSRGFQARGFVEEVITCYAPLVSNTEVSGVDHQGKPFAVMNFEGACSGSGAGMIKDGLDYAAAMFNPEGDMGDVETWEGLEPSMYLGRRVKPNTSGWGKFRGGSAFESLIMYRDMPFSEIGRRGASKTFFGGGLFGGYPNGTDYRHNIHNTDILERARRGEPYPVREGSPDESELTPLVRGKETFDKRNIALPEIYREGDIFLNCGRGASGLGNPLERAPAMVVADLNGNYITERFAKSVYGVIARRGDNGKWEVDKEATARQREAMRKQRAQRSIPVSEWRKKARERVLKKGFIRPVREMYAGSMNLSESWANEYRHFWNLPDNFTYEGD